MTSVYQQEKLYPEIPPTTRIDTDTQAYRLKKIEEAEKLKKRGNLAKRFKRRAMASEIAIYITTGTALSHRNKDDTVYRDRFHRSHKRW